MTRGLKMDYSVQFESDWPDGIAAIARAAGKVILDIYATDFTVRGKSDASPVTRADEEAEAVILSGLAKLSPNIPIVAEEEVAAGRIPALRNRFWLVDPLDGTKEFISRNGEFTVNIALVSDSKPVLGVVFAPALRRMFIGVVGDGAFVENDAGRRRIACRKTPEAGLTVVASRSHGNAEALDEFLAQRKVATIKNAGSSLKLCLVASGEADVYPRFGRTMEWDIAAGHAVLEAAGGKLVDMQGNALLYGKPDFSNPHFVAWGLGD